jgi:hypothetical protein
MNIFGENRYMNLKQTNRVPVMNCGCDDYDDCKHYRAGRVIEIALDGQTQVF